MTPRTAAALWTAVGLLADHAYDDVLEHGDQHADDAGDWPEPRCPAEETALHLILRYAESAVDDDWASLTGRYADLPEHKDNHNWNMLTEILFQDTDILALFSKRLDGIEDPDTDQNRKLGIGDYRPQAWFEWFLNVEPRNPGRPFRR
ncbi:hypothetical protein [Amycolatopsis jiangsuensis]|uniref:Uncharacterized protein n=1 Tax=Amycolatopsis jiangsuensis TaxID=1181879 RepID=A0A840J7E7_9PSEU|nr:hypothetical protein [Amycolatopsis jiangsuensis]MBB4689318.1 hypothetical protein [Amycolatopsis jiangsuensis]